MATSMFKSAVLSIGTVILSCGPIQVPATNVAQRCPKPCPSACPNSCLPSGYCSEVLLTAADLDLMPIEEPNSWTAGLGGFPANADIAYTINAGFDVAERDGQTPMYFHLLVHVNEGFTAFDFANDFSDFPVWRSFQSHDQSDANGTLQLVAVFQICEALLNDESLAGPVHCFLAPTSTFDATLVDTTPWVEAPICGT